jgi:hypothetical protein
MPFGKKVKVKTVKIPKDNARRQAAGRQVGHEVAENYRRRAAKAGRRGAR